MILSLNNLPNQIIGLIKMGVGLKSNIVNAVFII